LVKPPSARAMSFATEGFSAMISALDMTGCEVGGSGSKPGCWSH
jgi:hypothetical protein